MRFLTNYLCISITTLIGAITFINPVFAEDLDNDIEGTHWGLGGGVGIAQKPYKGYGVDVFPIPLVFIDNKWVRIAGPNFDGKLGSIDQFSFTIRAKLALEEGYKSSDSTAFHDMNKRKSGIWLGPTVTWNNSIADISAELLGDASGNSKGVQGTFDISKSYRFDQFEITPSIGATWINAKYVNYYYGVSDSEIANDRAFYKGKSTTSLNLGVRAIYMIDSYQSIMLMMDIKQYGNGISDSPLVDKSTVSNLLAGYVYRF